MVPEPPSRTRMQILGVHLHLEDADGRVLLGLRHPDSPFAGGMWHTLAGHCEQESATACLVREAEEEAGLLISPADVSFAHAVHLVDEPGGQPRIGFFFRAHRWQGSPDVREPDRCTRWQWWDPQALPDAVVPYTRAAIAHIKAGVTYAEMGWTA
ncbi:NUDIX hydrolase [Streptomyces indicus]|uniref:ADP-ribose pyrophosphatase YjhB, NUDIX family n=1 Tax=Streptomyces indicus TaxID=417292 RepID=A0A1G9GII4_9ACTN|nr:NUDIX domain-containing protein [Streptomyces indicus]SDL00412.1 ADP-ribose pyrophosphatase YjhB, NUDIX family [Streptomyces indicus]